MNIIIYHEKLIYSRYAKLFQHLKLISVIQNPTCLDSASFSGKFLQSDRVSRKNPQLMLYLMVLSIKSIQKKSAANVVLKTPWFPPNLGTWQEYPLWTILIQHRIRNSTQCNKARKRKVIQIVSVGFFSISLAILSQNNIK